LYPSDSNRDRLLVIIPWSGIVAGQEVITMPRKIRRSREEIRQVVQDFHASGLSADDFAKKIRIQRFRLAEWIRREGKVKRPAKLVQVDVKRPARVDSHTEIVVEGGLVLRVPRDFDPESLLRLLDVLEKRC
jgi:hypothetical protein